MIPGPWVFVLLALGAWRIWRLIAQDDLPPIERARNWLVGADFDLGEWIFKRELLAHFISCAYCSGFWIAFGTWLAWHIWPTGTVVAMTPWALSATVGLVAQRLG